jgi:hypothetical protein
MKIKTVHVGFWLGAGMQVVLSTHFMIQALATAPVMQTAYELVNLMVRAVFDAALFNLGVCLPLFMAVYVILTFPKSEDKPDDHG